MKLGFVTYQIGKDMDVPALIDVCQKTGFQGIELRTTHAHGVETTLSADERQAVRKQFEDGGIEPGLLPPRVERSLTAGAKRLGIGLTKSYDALSGQQQVLLLRGEDPDAAAKSARPFRGLLRLLEEWNDTYATENFRARLTRFRSTNSCPACRGRRLRPESLAVKVAELSIAEFAALPVDEAAGALASIRYVTGAQHLRDRHQERARTLIAKLKAAGIPVMPTVCHIVPVLVGDPILCKQASDALMNRHGIYIQPINYPTVPRGTERLRLTPTPLHTDAMIDEVVAALVDVWADLALKWAA